MSKKSRWPKEANFTKNNRLGETMLKLKLHSRASWLAVSLATGLAAPALAQTTATPPPPQQAPMATAPSAGDAALAGGSPSDTLQEVVVTGSTTKRTLLNASVAITAINSEDLAQKAPMGTDDILEMVPGIYVEGTAGPVSNNYSVRGLPGGGQQFIRLEEDGMPAIYGGLNDDEVFQYDLSIDRVEALEGGTSGILAPNAAGASINFISRKLNFDEGAGLFKLQGASYGDERADFWYSAPLALLGPNVAYAVSGYYDSDPGTRSSPFRYSTYHFKGQLEKRFDGGGSVMVTYKRWDEHDPYYADQPYADVNGKITSVPGLNTQTGSIIGPGLGSITVPDSCASNECTRTFSELNGIHATGNEYRIDFNKPIDAAFSVFAKVRYTQTDWDFNGVFAGSGTGNSGLASAETYLTNNANSPIQSLLQAGLAAYPTTAQFGIKNLSNGQVIPASNVAALNGLNGNGLLQQTVLNHQLVKLRDWGSDFGVKWNASGSGWSNSLTVGGMIYSTHESNDQSGVATVVNDVKNESNLYDIVALNSAGAVVGDLSNNGLISYGDWGSGISNSDQESQSAYFNDEFTFREKLHIDIGLRYEHESETSASGNSSSLPVPVGTAGVVQVNPNAFNGTFSYASGSESPVNFTVGANYTINSSLSVYGRYAHSYETNGENPQPTALTLYEGGVTYGGYGVLATVRGFRTEFDNQSFGGGVDPANPNLDLGFFANSDTDGVDLDLTYRPRFEALRAFSVHAQATYQQSSFNNVSVGTITINGVNEGAVADSFYDGKTPHQTPSLLYTITPAYDLPYNLGSVYMRYKYIGQIFADNGDQVVLPGYGVVSFGGLFNVAPKIVLNVSVDNATNVLGLTEGNPRQGFTQDIVGGYFYGRGIVGTTAQASLTVKF
jgi:outer membrane receptor protein involved in Fe transport